MTHKIGCNCETCLIRQEDQTEPEDQAYDRWRDLEAEGS